jgi:hypothetical protein
MCIHRHLTCDKFEHCIEGSDELDRACLGYEIGSESSPLAFVVGIFGVFVLLIVTMIACLSIFQSDCLFSVILNWYNKFKDEKKRKNDDLIESQRIYNDNNNKD